MCGFFGWSWCYILPDLVVLPEKKVVPSLRSASIRIATLKIRNQTMRRKSSILALVILLDLIISTSAAQRSIESHWEGGCWI